MVVYLKLYILTIPVFFILDMIWLGGVAKGFYRRNLPNILSTDVNWTAAVCFYLIYVAGIVFFAVGPAAAADSMRQAALLGALYGFFTYATYDLTNMATIKDWPLVVVIVDMMWGVGLCTLVAAAGVALSGWLL